MISTTLVPYAVTLSCYVRDERNVMCLTPLVLCCARAGSPQEVAYLAMQQCNLLYVDRAEVALPDGAVWSQNRVFYRNVYDVAVWRKDRPGELPLFNTLVQADSPLLAALKLMCWHKLTYAACVSVGCPDGSMWRKESLKRDSETSQFEQEEGEGDE